MTGKLLLAVLVVFYLTAGTGVAEEKKQPDKKPKVLSKEDQEILKMMETLKLLDLVKNINLLEDLDILIEDVPNEKND